MGCQLLSSGRAAPPGHLGLSCGPEALAGHAPFSPVAGAGADGALGSPYFRGMHLTCFWDISLTVVL